MNLLQFCTVSSLNLDAVRNISKASLDPTIMLLKKYVGQHVPYLPASCQMNCSIPIWCHMCMEACSTSDRCCWNALGTESGRKVIRDNKHPKWQCGVTKTTQNISARLPLHCQGAVASQKKRKGAVLFSGDKPGEQKRLGMKLVRMYKGELEKMRRDKRDCDTFRRASL